MPTIPIRLWHERIWYRGRQSFGHIWAGTSDILVVCQRIQTYVWIKKITEFFFEFVYSLIKNFVQIGLACNLWRWSPVKWGFLSSTALVYIAWKIRCVGVTLMTKFILRERYAASELRWRIVLYFVRATRCRSYTGWLWFYLFFKAWETLRRSYAGK